MKNILIIFLLLFSNTVVAKVEIWECYIPKERSKFSDGTIVSVYKLDTDAVTVAYLSGGKWSYYDSCCDIFFDKEKHNLNFTFLGDIHIFDLLLKERFVDNFKYQCNVIGP